MMIQGLLAVFGGIFIAALCGIGCYCYREDTFVRRSIFGGQDRDIIYAASTQPPRVMSESKSVRVWSMSGMRDTVLDPKALQNSNSTSSSR